MARCIEVGYVQRLVMEERYKHSTAVERGKRKVFGSYQEPVGIFG